MRPLSSTVRLVILTLSLPLATSAHAGVVEVTTCGQSFTGRGVLMNDLDCTGLPPARASVEVVRGRLDMNGFTISNGTAGVRCLKRCRINGPGTIIDHSFDGIDAKGPAKVVGVDLIDNNHFGIQCFRSCSVVGPATISGHADYGIVSPKNVKVTGMAITGNRGGIRARNSDGKSRVRMRDSLVTGNEFGIDGDKVKVSGSEITGNATGGIILGRRLNDPCNERRRTAAVKNSVVTGNDGGATCGVSETCADLMLCRPPRLKDVTCDTSYLLGSGVPGSDLDLCALD